MSAITMGVDFRFFVFRPAPMMHWCSQSIMLFSALKSSPGIMPL